METCTQQTMKSKEVITEYGMKITSNENTKETLIYGNKHGSSATTKTKPTLTQHSSGGSSKRKNENRAKTCQESNGKQHLSISPIILKLKEGGELREERKEVKTVNAVNRNVEMKNKGKKKRKTNLTEKKREENRIPDVTITPNTERKRKLTDEGIHQQKKSKTEEIVKVTVGENRRETWANLIQSISEHLKTCNEETGIKPIKFQVMHSFTINDKKSTIEFVSKSKNSNTEVARIKITKKCCNFCTFQFEGGSMLMSNEEYDKFHNNTKYCEKMFSVKENSSKEQTEGNLNRYNAIKNGLVPHKR